MEAELREIDFCPLVAGNEVSERSRLLCLSKWGA
jgi:hypothetical protein